MGVVQTMRMRQIRDLVNREGWISWKLNKRSWNAEMENCVLFCERMIVWEWMIVPSMERGGGILKMWDGGIGNYVSMFQGKGFVGVR